LWHVVFVILLAQFVNLTSLMSHTFVIFILLSAKNRTVKIIVMWCRSLLEFCDADQFVGCTENVNALPQLKQQSKMFLATLSELERGIYKRHWKKGGRKERWKWMKWRKKVRLTCVIVLGYIQFEWHSSGLRSKLYNKGTQFLFISLNLCNTAFLMMKVRSVYLYMMDLRNYLLVFLYLLYKHVSV
jgi:hypothetical protein